MVDVPDHDRQPDDPIWTTGELLSFLERVEFDIQEWALRQLIQQDPDRAREILPEFEERVEMKTDHYRVQCLRPADDPDRVQALADQFQTDLEEGTELKLIDEISPVTEARVFSILSQKRHLLENVMDGHQAWCGLLILEYGTKQWTSNLFRKHLNSVDELRPEELFWESARQIGDPELIQPLLEKWSPESTTQASLTLDFLARLAKVRNQLPEEVRARAEEHREGLREIGRQALEDDP